MKKTYLINGLLLLIIVGLYWFVNRPDTVETNAPKLSSLAFNAVHNIQIQRNEKNTISLIKQGDSWQIDHPIQAKANDVKVKLLLSVLNSTIYSQTKITEFIDLSQFNLEPPAFSLYLNDQRFDLGDIESLTKHRYLRYGNTVYLVDDTIAPLLNSSINSFIENRLIAENQQISKLHIPLIHDNKPTNSSQLIEQIDSHWQAVDFSADQLTELVASWQQAYALQVMPLNIEQLEQNQPQYKATLWFEGDHIARHYLITSNQHSLFIYDLSRQLNYQFPLGMLPALLLSKPES